MRKRILGAIFTIMMIFGLTPIIANADDPAVTELTVGGINALTTTSGTNWSYDGVDTLTLSGDVGNILATGDLKIKLTSDVTITTASTDEPIKVYGSLVIDATGYTLTADSVDMNRITIAVSKYDSSETGDITVIGGKVVAFADRQNAFSISGNFVVNGSDTTVIAYNNRNAVLSVVGDIANNGNMILNNDIRFSNDSDMSTVTNNGRLYYLGNNCVDSDNLTILNNSLLVTGVTAYDVATNTITVSDREAVIDVENNTSISCNVIISENSAVQVSGDSVLTIPLGNTFSNQGCLIMVDAATISGVINGNQFSILKYLITFDDNVSEGSWISPNNMPPVQNILEGGKVTEPEAPVDGRDRYVFCGWYTDVECRNKYDFDTVVTNSMTLYAGWGKNDFSSATVTLSDNEIVYGEALPTIIVTEEDDSVLESDEYSVTYIKDGQKFSTPKNAGIYTVVVEGLCPFYGTAIQKPVLTIHKAEQTSPNVQSTGASAKNVHDGKITGVNSRMEYSADNGETWTSVVGTEIAGLSAGTYHVRYAENENYNASQSAKVIIEAYNDDTPSNESDSDNMSDSETGVNNNMMLWGNLMLVAGVVLVAGKRWRV